MLDFVSSLSMLLIGPYNSKSTFFCISIRCLHVPSYSKKTKIQSQNLAGKILEGLMPITTEPEPEDSDDDAPCRVSQLQLTVITR